MASEVAKGSKTCTGSSLLAGWEPSSQNSDVTARKKPTSRCGPVAVVCGATRSAVSAGRGTEFCKKSSQLQGREAAQKRPALELFHHGLVKGPGGMATIVADTSASLGTAAVTIVSAATIAIVTSADITTAATVATGTVSASASA
ncbi:hypothetical protein NDU88_008574 [Pleurodeles waltl]|uniref:Uncharacterized protein n=1 Tax=Pleurodeles waltl TaxID=8319 RepID=A0AAV7NY75_PLEWA|nr:hypothetical protein NDU88_008574 [Pleurodeles waltl]